MRQNTVTAPPHTALGGSGLATVIQSVRVLNNSQPHIVIADDLSSLPPETGSSLLFPSLTKKQEALKTRVFKL